MQCQPFQSIGNTGISNKQKTELPLSVQLCVLLVLPTEIKRESKYFSFSILLDRSTKITLASFVHTSTALESKITEKNAPFLYGYDSTVHCQVLELL